MNNSFGEIFRLTTFGESHGPAIGGVIDGAPPGIRLNEARIEQAMRRRRPGTSPSVSARSEADKVEFLSGLKDSVTLGTPIAFVIKNTDSRSSDYDSLEHLYRPGHADFTTHKKYGIRDHRGGGRASARETACRVVGGAVAQEVLRSRGIAVGAFLKQVGGVSLQFPPGETIAPREMAEYLLHRDSLSLPCPDAGIAAGMMAEIESVRKAADSVGGIVECAVYGLPIGIGEPVYNKLQSRLAAAMLSINAAKGFEYGGGFSLASRRGSEVRDEWSRRDMRSSPSLTVTNHSGGIQGGISNGMPVYFRVAFKPTPTTPGDARCLASDGTLQSVDIKGRHDPCVAVRGVAVVEAMAAMTILDMLLMRRATRPFDDESLLY